MKLIKKVTILSIVCLIIFGTYVGAYNTIGLNVLEPYISITSITAVNEFPYNNEGANPFLDTFVLPSVAILDEEIGYTATYKDKYSVLQGIEYRGMAVTNVLNNVDGNFATWKRTIQPSDIEEYNFWSTLQLITLSDFVYEKNTPTTYAPTATYVLGNNVAPITELHVGLNADITYKDGITGEIYTTLYEKQYIYQLSGTENKGVTWALINFNDLDNICEGMQTDFINVSNVSLRTSIPNPEAATTTAKYTGLVYNTPIIKNIEDVYRRYAEYMSQGGTNFKWSSITDWLIEAIGGFFEAPLFGEITLGDMLFIAIGISLVIAFLKFFAGG